MKGLLSPIGKGMKFIFALVVFIFILSLSYGFARRVYPDNAMNQIMMLALYDFGAFVWYFTFKNSAEGTYQRAVCIGMFLISILGVVLLVGAETLTTDAANMAGITIETLRGYATWSVIGLGMLHLLATYLYSLVHPDSLNEIREKWRLERIQEHENAIEEAAIKQEAEIDKRSLKNLDKLMDEIASELANAKAAGLRTRILNRMGMVQTENGFRLSDGIIPTNWRDAPTKLSGASDIPVRNPPPLITGKANNTRARRFWNLPNFVNKRMATTVHCPTCQSEQPVQSVEDGNLQCTNCQTILTLQPSTNGHTENPTEGWSP